MGKIFGYGHPAQDVRKKVMKRADELVKYDNVDKVDLSNKEGEVVIDLKKMREMGENGVEIKSEYPYNLFEEVTEARVTFDPETKKVKTADIKCEEFVWLEGYNSRGWGGGDKIEYKVEEKEEKTGLLGIMGEKKEVKLLKEKRDDYFGVENIDNTVKIDGKTDRIIDYKGKEFAMTPLEATKEVFTTRTGLGATIGIGLLAGALGGPVAGATAAGATALAVGYEKVHPGIYERKANEAWLNVLDAILPW